MKRNFKLLLIMVAAFMVTYSCTNKSRQSTDEAQQPEIGIIDEHTSQNSLDWAGTYSGIMPCADCEGIETELTLNNDNTYTLKTSYLGVEEPADETLTGSFTWEDGNIIKLGGISDNSRSPFVKVEENRVRYLGLQRNVITGELESYYILSKK